MASNFLSTQSFEQEYFIQLSTAGDVYQRLCNDGLEDGMLCRFEVIFTSNTADKLRTFKNLLVTHYKYKMQEPLFANSLYEMRGETIHIPVDLDNLKCWVIDLHMKAFKCDCKFEAYQTSIEKNNVSRWPTAPANDDEYFDRGLADYDNQNLSGAIMNWSTAIHINPEDPNYYYSRAIAKQDLKLLNEALADYDKALELAPDFNDALINRATLKDELGRSRRR